MKDTLHRIVEATKNRELNWERQGNSHSFFAFGVDNCLYSISEQADGEKVFEAVDENGVSFCYEKSSHLAETDGPDMLYNTIVEQFPNLARSINSTVSLTKIKERLKFGVRPTIKNNDSFAYINSRNCYIEPNFSQQMTSEGITKLEDAQVIAISAPGATGKTALTEHLSTVMNIPVFNMQEHSAVGSNSLLGMLFKTLSIEDFSVYVQALKDGKTTMIIDALDEGYVKTSNAAFESFLDDLVAIASDNMGVPFVIMGRISTLELATLYLELKGVRVSMLQLEPFTRKKAEQFIDDVLEDKTEREITYKTEYKAVRNYILDSLEAFFKSESEIGKRQAERFIGYAPVLVSIVCLLKDEKNFIELKNELERGNAKNIALLKEIVEFTMNREHDKVKDAVRTLLRDADLPDIESVVNQAYDYTEQCARVLAKVCETEYKRNLTENPVVNDKYEELVNNWMKQHPFIADERIDNIVFEAYIISSLIDNGKFREQVLYYLDDNWRNSYILFDLYNTMCGEGRILENKFVKYLIDSYKATDKGCQRHFIDLNVVTENTDGSVECELTFESIGNAEYEPFSISLKKDEILDMPRVLSNINIEAPICIGFRDEKTELSPITNICCKKVSLLSSDVLLTPSYNDDAIVIECEEFDDSISKGKQQMISNSAKIELDILTNAHLYFPFARYRKNPKINASDDEEFYDKYQKMRRTIMNFRSHSRGSLAKYKEKIDNRIGCTDLGKRVVDGLLKEGIMVDKGRMYFINEDVMAEKLGLNYNDLRTYEVNDKIKKFLNNV